MFLEILDKLKKFFLIEEKNGLQEILIQNKVLFCADGLALRKRNIRIQFF